LKIADIILKLKLIVVVLKLNQKNGTGNSITTLDNIYVYRLLDFAPVPFSS